MKSRPPILFTPSPRGEGRIMAALTKTGRENGGSPESVFNINPLLSITSLMAVFILAAFTFKAAKITPLHTRGYRNWIIGGLEMEAI